jgi:hypothetical protein
MSIGGVGAVVGGQGKGAGAAVGRWGWLKRAPRELARTDVAELMMEQGWKHLVLKAARRRMRYCWGSGGGGFVRGDIMMRASVCLASWRECDTVSGAL